MDERQLGLSDVESRFLAGCRDERLTRRRMRQVLFAASVFAALLVIVTWFTRSWLGVLLIALLYIAITTWEKLSYGRGVLVYKSVVRKLVQRLDELETGHGPDR